MEKSDQNESAVDEIFPLPTIHHNKSPALLRHLSRLQTTDLKTDDAPHVDVWCEAKLEGVLDPNTKQLYKDLSDPSTVDPMAFSLDLGCRIAASLAKNGSKARRRPQSSRMRKNKKQSISQRSSFNRTPIMGPLSEGSPILEAVNIETRDIMLKRVSSDSLDGRVRSQSYSEEEYDTEGDVIYLNAGTRHITFENPILDKNDLDLFYLGDEPPPEPEKKQRKKRWKDIQDTDFGSMDVDVKMKTIIQQALVNLRELKMMMEPETEEANKYNTLLTNLQSKLDVYLNKLTAWKSIVGTGDEDCSDIQSLLRMGKSHWQFNNPLVHSYRQQVYKKWGDHYDVDPKSIHMPQYYSDMALPATGETKGGSKPYYLLEISIDKSLMEETKHTLNASNIITNVLHMHKTTADFIIQDSFRKYKAKLPAELKPTWVDPENFVIKAAGYHAYMYGDTKLAKYEYIRRCIRESTGAKKSRIQLILVRKPDLKMAATNYVTEFKAKLREAERLTVTTGPHKIGGGLDAKSLDISNYTDAETKRFIRIKLKSIDLTKFDRANECKTFRVEAVLFAGFTRLDKKEETHTPHSRLHIGHKRHSKSYDGALHWELKDAQGTPSRDDSRWKSMKLVTWNTLPRSARLGIQVWGMREDEKTPIRLGFVVQPMVNRYGVALTGDKTVRMWSVPLVVDKHAPKPKPDPEFLFKQTVRENLWKADTFFESAPFINFEVEWDDALGGGGSAPYHYAQWEPSKKELSVLGTKCRLRDNAPKIEALMKAECDPLFTLTSNHKELLWACRHHLVDKPNMLSKFFQAVDYTNPSKVNEAHRLLKEWTFPEPVQALELLDCKYHDFVLRKWAVDKLDTLPDHILAIYILQLVQCLKYETYTDSALALMLIRRSLANPYQIGHYFFWLLKAELHVPHFHERFALILEEYLTYAANHAEQLRLQNTSCKMLVDISELIIAQTRNNTDEKTIRLGYVENLKDFNAFLSKDALGMMLPSDPRLRVTKVRPTKCKYMSSKMVPLWLCFENANPPPSGTPVFIMFKNGDDLRQDMLTIQLLRRMDEMWLADKLDMRLTPYEVMPTGVNDHGQGVGMIMPVLQADNIADIQHDFGGGAQGALKVTPILNFIEHHNKTGLTHAKENFYRSCAGYLVATYILGIGDRHNGNLMVANKGHLFHIDFGHFLGNFKSKFGFKRERTAFVLTPEMAHVMGGTSAPLFTAFKSLCSKGFVTLRNNARELEYLFMLMVPAGMPELLIEPDIYYMRDKLNLHHDDKKASHVLQAEIRKALNSKYRRFDNFIHILKHA